MAREYPEELVVYLDREGRLDPRPRLKLEDLGDSNFTEVDYRELLSGSWRFILLDQRETSREAIDLLRPVAPLAAVDEGGERRRFDYLIDTLPRLDRQQANLLLPTLNGEPNRQNPCPARGESVAEGPNSILISFGAEDPLCLSLPTARMLIEACGIPASRITIVEGPLYKPLTLPESLGRATILKAPRNLADHLGDYDLLICSYGLTALEALRTGTPVITINPSRYHERLARRVGLPTAGRGRVKRGGLHRLIADYPRLVEVSRRAAEDLAAEEERGAGGTSLFHLAPEARDCPGCGNRAPRLIDRFPERSFYRCGGCRLLFQQRWLKDTTEYNQAYFFEEYKRQYGKSYLEDYEHIKAMGRARLQRILRLRRNISRSISREPGGSLLDIGCAYGPFLEAAAEAGFAVEGVEPAEEAARYTRERLKSPVANSGLAEYAVAGGRGFDVVTLWYVIEHFKELRETLDILAKLTNDEGILAFSTPNARGISARRNLRRFLGVSPADHYTILDPRSVKKLLSAHGFRVEGFHFSGLHRDRFPAVLRIFWPVIRPLAVRWGLGDTFEVYARKCASQNPTPQGVV